jgi:competence protein ComEC
VFLVILAAAMAVSLIWEDRINSALGLKKTVGGAFNGKSADEVVEIADGAEGKSLTVHYVDVGQGDACIIELPDDKKMIIDGGKDTAKSKLLSYIDEKIDGGQMKDKKAAGGYGFDYAVLTHSDEDHCGGLDDVLTTYAAKVFYRPNELSTYTGFTDPGAALLSATHGVKETAAYKRVIEAGHTSEEVYINGGWRHTSDGSDIIEPEGIEIGSPLYYKFVFYSPLSDKYADFNDYSPVIILYYNGKSFMFSGDAEKTAETEFVAAAAEKAGKFSVFTDSFSVDAVKLGHHGSQTSSSEAFLETLTTAASRPNVLAIVSCGKDNFYGHPHEATLNRLKDMGFKDENVLRTDLNGTIVLAVSRSATGTWELLYGAAAVQREEAALKIGDVAEILWRELCIAAWIFLALVLLVAPLLGKKKTKAAKKYTPGSKR